MIYEFVDKVLVHKPEKIDGERTMEVEIYLKYIGKVEVPPPDPATIAAEEEARRKEQQRKNHERYLRKKEKKQLAAEQSRPRLRTSHDVSSKISHLSQRGPPTRLPLLFEGGQSLWTETQRLRTRSRPTSSAPVLPCRRSWRSWRMSMDGAAACPTSPAS
ncbi:MAG: DUF4368 domain-containing protein [Clostridiales bacterium]|nr:DUF4368 domain-containing protein [Clostridiales bacterium]